MLQGQDLFAQVETQAKKASLKVQEDKHRFVDREEERLAFLEKDKLMSMKQIMAYEAEIANFASAHVNLNREIQAAQDANALIQACINHAHTDKTYMTEVFEQAQADLEQMQQEEQEAEEEEAPDGEEELIADGEEPEQEQEEQNEEEQEEGEEQQEDFDPDLEDDQIEEPTEPAN